MKKILYPFIGMCFVLFIHCGGASEDSGTESPDSDAAGSQLITDSPTLKLELNSQAVGVSLAVSSRVTREASEVGSESVGGCMSWSIRKNAKVNTSSIQYMQCMYKAATEAGLIELEESETLYLDFGTEESSIPTRVSESSGVVTISICNQSTTEEDMRVTIQEQDDGYIVSGTSVETNEDEGFTVYNEVSVDTSTSGVETRSFINHFVNETDADLCDGASGTSLTEDDTTCFLRYQGTFVNNTTDSDNPFSLLYGTFAEKNNNGIRTISSLYSKFMDGVGATLFSAGLADVNSDVNESTDVDSWTPIDFITTTDASFVDDISGEDLPARTVSLPSIDSPWDCQGGTTELEIDYNDYSSFVASLECDTESLSSADMTNCTGGEEELSGVIDGYLNDENDPLIQ